MNHFLELLFPRRCPVCDNAVTIYGQKICPECIGNFKKIKEPYCFKCGKELQDSTQEYCQDCFTREHKYECGRALYQYESAASSIYRFKYKGRKEYGEYYAEEMVKVWGDFLKGIQPDVIIPVPMFEKKKKKRGYNQAEILAKEIGKRINTDVKTDIVERIRNTRPLKELSGRERENNLKKAFKIKENDVKLKTILIVDDIYTTGSTMNEIARVLKENSNCKIYFLALSIGAGL